LVGVLNGSFSLMELHLKPTFANSVAASTTFGTNPNTGSTDGIGFVNDDPYQEYIVKSDAAVPQTKTVTAFNVKTSLQVMRKMGNQQLLAVDGGEQAQHKNVPCR
jgi:hypothetical protein